MSLSVACEEAVCELADLDSTSSSKLRFVLSITSAGAMGKRESERPYVVHQEKCLRHAWIRRLPLSLMIFLGSSVPSFSLWGVTEEMGV